MMLNISASSLFLSRLCGGEACPNYQPITSHFLSRLCGGEAQAEMAQAAANFLSRLCGGEGIMPAIV